MALLTEGKDGSDRIVIESARYVAKFRDGAGVVQVVPTGCRDETAARQVLAELERQAELVRSGVITTAEASVGRHQSTPLDEHFDAFLAHLEAAGTTQEHRANVSRQLRRVAGECSFSRLADLHRETLERWLTAQTQQGMGARTRNTYLSAYVSFANWCADPTVNRLAGNPFTGLAKANEKADPRRQRRAMTEGELVKLLAVARQRPLIDAATIRRGKRKGQQVGKLSDQTRRRLERLGWERSLIYKTLVLSGLRRGELASLSVAQMHLDEEVAYATLDAGDEKNREGSQIAIRADLAADLRQWLADKLQCLQDKARKRGEPIPLRLPPETLLFTVPRELVKILNRDLKLAGIPKRDDRGRTLDIHALRHTHGTLLSKGGVSPRTAQASMRHSDIKLTMNNYTDPRLLDVHGALDVLPTLPLDTGRSEQEAVRSTGTDDTTMRKFAPGFAPGFAPNADNQGQALSPSGNPSRGDPADTVAASGSPDKRSDPLTTAVSGSGRAGDRIRTGDVQLGKLPFRARRKAHKSLTG
jgi:integrase